MKDNQEIDLLKFENTVWPYRLVVPFLFGIGGYVHFKKILYRILLGRGHTLKTNFWFVDGISSNSRKVKDGAKKWNALDAVYNFTNGEGSNVLIRAIDDFWMRIRSAQAVRNRLLIVKREMISAITKVSKRYGNSPVRILSIAAGSGQAVVEAVEELQKVGVVCEILFFDCDESALEHSLVLAKEHGVTNVSTYKGDAPLFGRALHRFEPDIIEMCGLMDYLRTSLAIALVKKIHRYLKPEGFFVTCHIHPNSERYFLYHVVDWGMLYRTRGELYDILVRGGFLDAKLYTEPHRIHSVAVSQKL